MLASTASMQGRHAALHALGASTASLDLTTVPWTIFTRPEVASVGLTAGEADRQGADVAVTKHYLGANPRGVISGNNEGMIKLVASAADGVLLGASIVGYRASEMIATLARGVVATGCRGSGVTAWPRGRTRSRPRCTLPTATI